MKTTTVRPGKGASISGIIAGVFFLIFGLAFGYFMNKPLWSSTKSPGLENLILTDIILIGWIALTIYMIVYYNRCLKGEKNTDLYEFETKNSEGLNITTNQSQDIVTNVQERLDALNKLKDNGKITDNEYQQQRVEILKNI